MSESAFNKTKFNSSPTQSAKSAPRAKNPSSGGTSVKHSSSRGVEHPIPEDFALIGDTRHELHTKPLARRKGPNFGAEEMSAPGPDHFRVESGGSASDDL